MAQEKELKVNSRVKQAKKNGLQGIVQEVCEETTARADAAERSLMIRVLWDNGTMSYFSPEALEVVR